MKREVVLMKREVVLGLLCSLGLLFSAPLVRAAQKPDPPPTDPQIEVALNYVRNGATLDITNRASAPIVYWRAIFGADPAQRPPGFSAVPWWLEVTCYGVKGGFDVIEPGEVRHAATSLPPGCGKAPPFRLAAVFADGSWTGAWSDLEKTLRAWRARRLAGQQWVDSLREIRVAPDPIGKLSNLMEQVERASRREINKRAEESLLRSWNCPAGWRGPCRGNDPPKNKPPYEVPGASTLLPFVYRGYDHLLGSPPRLASASRRGGPPSNRPGARRDKGAEKALKSRADVKELLDERIVAEIALVQTEIEDTAWLTLLGPNGERVGPAEPPPPPRLASVLSWRMGPGPFTQIGNTQISESGIDADTLSVYRLLRVLAMAVAILFF